MAYAWHVLLETASPILSQGCGDPNTCQKPDFKGIKITHFAIDPVICIFRAVSLQTHQKLWNPRILTCNVIYFMSYTKCPP